MVYTCMMFVTQILQRVREFDSNWRVVTLDPTVLLAASKQLVFFQCYQQLVGWSLTSLFSTNTAISQTTVLPVNGKMTDDYSVCSE